MLPNGGGGYSGEWAYGYQHGRVLRGLGGACCVLTGLHEYLNIRVSSCFFFSRADSVRRAHYQWYVFLGILLYRFDTFLVLRASARNAMAISWNQKLNAFLGNHYTTPRGYCVGGFVDTINTGVTRAFEAMERRRRVPHLCFFFFTGGSVALLVLVLSLSLSLSVCHPVFAGYFHISQWPDLRRRIREGQPAREGVACSFLHPMLDRTQADYFPRNALKFFLQRRRSTPRGYRKQRPLAHRRFFSCLAGPAMCCDWYRWTL